MENDRFVWTTKYSVNVAEIDEQHKEFIKIVNSLLDLGESEFFTDEEALVKVGQLGSYALYHLSTEEDLFIKTKYKDAIPHIEAHNKFREQAMNFENQIREEDKDKKTVLKDAAHFAGSWLLNHILVVDKKYSEFFNENGIK